MGLDLISAFKTFIRFRIQVSSVKNSGFSVALLMAMAGCAIWHSAEPNVIGDQPRHRSATHKD